MIATCVPNDIQETPQHLRALQRANEVRLARAELKRQIGDGKVSVDEVVLTNAWEAGSMTMSDLLMSQKRWGRMRCRRFLAAIPLPETKTVCSLTERQRGAVAEALRAVDGPVGTTGERHVGAASRLTAA